MGVGAEVTSGGRLFQRRLPATGNARSLTVMMTMVIIYIGFFGMHNKNYKYEPNDGNVCVTASFIPSLVEVGLTPYLLHRNM